METAKDDRVCQRFVEPRGRATYPSDIGLFGALIAERRHGRAVIAPWPDGPVKGTKE